MGDAHSSPQQKRGLEGGAALWGQGRDRCPLCVQQQRRMQLLVGPAAPPCPAPRGTGSKAGGGGKRLHSAVLRHRGCKGSVGKGVPAQSSGVSPTWNKPQAPWELLGQLKRFLMFELLCKAAALKKNKSHFLQHGSCCSICWVGRGWEGAQVPLQEQRNRS